MIYKNKHELSSEILNFVRTTAIYKGTVIVWQAIRSCFGAGFWAPEKSWLGEETWKNE